MKIIFTCPRQKRALEALLNHPAGISCYALGQFIGALNPRQTVMELRKLNFLGLIVTRRFSVKDRDGRNCFPGEYYMPLEYHASVREALKKEAVGAQKTNPTTSTSDKHYGSKGGHNNAS